MPRNEENSQKWRKDYARKNKDHIKEYMRTYRIKNRDKLTAQHKKWRYKNPGAVAKAKSAWAKAHRGSINEYNVGRYNELKLEVISHYSPEFKCMTCGFTDIRALVIDHVNGGGNAHRRKVGKGITFYYWLKRHNFPEGFQILCSNCNIIKKIVNHEYGTK